MAVSVVVFVVIGVLLNHPKKTKIDLLSLSIKFCGTSYVILMKILYNWRNDINNPVNTELITNIQRPAVKFKAEGNES